MSSSIHGLKELVEKRRKANELMPAGWFTDLQVAEALRAKKIEKNQGVTIYWPTGISTSGATTLSEDDQAYLRLLMARPDSTTIVIPHNTGNHWYPTMLFKQKEQWFQVDLSTRGDGTCGASLVEEAHQFITQGPQNYMRAHGNRASAITWLAPNTLARNIPQISIPTTNILPKEAKLPAPLPVTALKTVSISPSKENEDALLDIAMRASTSGLSAFDLELTYLADAEYEKNQAKIKACQKNLRALLKEMSPEAIHKIKQRLCDSGLDKKVSIQVLFSAPQENRASFFSSCQNEASKTTMDNALGLPQIPGCA